MPIVEVNLRNPRQVKQFLDLPFHIYRDIPQWVPPLAMDARRMLDPRRHPFYRHSEAAFFLALNEAGRAVGRLAVLNNRNYNDFNSELLFRSELLSRPSRTAFFYLFECEEDYASAEALFRSASDWAKGRGLEEIIGPKGFTALDGLGLLVRGFEHRPAFGLPYNPPYYVNLIESNGFQPSGENVSGCLRKTGYQFPEKILRASELIQKRRGLKVERYRTRRELRTLVPKLGALYNAALGGTSGGVPLTDDEVKTIADQILWFADPTLIKIITKEGEPVGFVFAYPDISAALQRTKGRMFPFGWLDMLLELRRTKWVNINGAGIIEQYRGLGGTALLFSELYKTATESRYEGAEVVQIGVENEIMQREMRGLGIDFYKTHRIYRKEIGG